MNRSMIPNMRCATFAVVAVLACASTPALAQSNDAAPPAVQTGEGVTPPPLQPPTEATSPQAHAGEAAPASGVLVALQSAVLDDIAKVRSDIAESQAERGGSLLDRI